MKASFAMLSNAAWRCCAHAPSIALTLALVTLPATASGQTLPAPSTTAQESAPAPPPPVIVETPAPSAPTAAVESTTPADDAAVKGLERFFAGERSVIPPFRLATTVAAVAVAAPAIPAGAVLLDRGQTGEGCVAVGFGAGALLGAALVWVVPVGPLQPVVDTFEKNKAEGLSGARLLDVTERDWREQARKAALGRRSAAVGMAVVGAAAVVFGTYATTTTTQIASLSASEQAGWGTFALVAGGASVLGAAAAYFMPTPVEETYDLYRAVSGRPAPAVARNGTGVHVTPLVGPGAVGLAGTF